MILPHTLKLMPLNQRNYDTPEIDAKMLDNRMRQNKSLCDWSRVTQSVLLIFFSLFNNAEISIQKPPEKKDSAERN